MLPADLWELCGLSTGDLEKLPSWQFSKTRSENAVSASLNFSGA
jgi:hypothetical protein